MNLTNNSLLPSTIDHETLKCSLHKDYYLHFLHLNSNSKKHKICSECKLENNILDREVLIFLELFE